jgi:hypothetical protein
MGWWTVAALIVTCILVTITICLWLVLIGLDLSCMDQQPACIARHDADATAETAIIASIVTGAMTALTTLCFAAFLVTRFRRRGAHI